MPQNSLKSIFKLSLVFLFLRLPLSGYSQTATLIGAVRDIYNVPIPGANVYLPEFHLGTITNQQGYYELKVPANKKLLVQFSYFGNTSEVNVKALTPGENHIQNINLNSDVTLNEYQVTAKKNEQKGFMSRVDSRALDVLPSPTDKVTTIIKTLPGVSSNNEMSSDYSVRGGNYDENLVYINNVEVYRPFLIKEGQQEGLSIINSDLVSDIQFSAGGFEAKYGDKMSSVLDLKYKEPKDFHGSLSASLLGFSGHVEGSSVNRKFTYLAGVRQHSNSYLLNTLDVKGEYKSSFTDFQSYLTYYFNKRTTLSLFSYYGRNLYKIIPQTQETNYGTMNLVLRLKVYFDGQEVTTSNRLLNAMTFTWQPRDSFKLQFICSAYNTTETEYFDIMGQYWLAQVDIDQSSPTYNQAKSTIGVGTFLNHARDRLDAYVYNIEHKGTWVFKKSELQWGLKAQVEQINDNMKEWQLLDSSDYSIPVTPSDSSLALNNFLKTKINLYSFRYSSYLQNTFTLSDSNSMYLTTGIRGGYWDYNRELFITPRLQFYYMPNRKHNLEVIKDKMPDSLLKKNIALKLAIGMYYQPVFYRELRDMHGVLNPGIRAQKSIQIVAGNEMMIKLWGKPFRWTTEAYFKYLYDLIPYDVEDVRIRYYAKNDAIGYATGVDMQLYGEFVKNLPSWISASYLKTMEDVKNDGRGFIPRPTDQAVHVSIFFQDLFPNNPTSKVHLNFVYGSRLPFGPPNFDSLRAAFRMRSYKRVDIGFSKLLYSADKNIKHRFKAVNRLTSIWVSGEIFNLFGNQNTISYFWVKDVNNNYWGVPDYLTGRRFNVSLIMRF